jgi:hypothetical protein
MRNNKAVTFNVYVYVQIYVQILLTKFAAVSLRRFEFVICLIDRTVIRPVQHFESGMSMI